MKQKAHIENWSVQNAYGGGTYLIGTISKHPKQYIFHSDLQATSLLKSLDRESKTAETQNTIYTLGKEQNGN